MRKFLTTILFVMGLSGIANANDIYIQQIGTGNGLDLSITQDGVNNVMGTNGAKVILSGANHTWTVSQIGGANVIAAQIRGNTYTGTWAITGNSNDILFKCASAASSKCETATGNITVNGNSSNIDILSMVMQTYSTLISMVNLQSLLYHLITNFHQVVIK